MKKNSTLIIIFFYVFFSLLSMTFLNKIMFEVLQELDQVRNYEVYQNLFHILTTMLILYFLMRFFERKSTTIDSILTSVFQVIPDILFVMKKDGTIVDYRAETKNDLYIKPEAFLNFKMQQVLPTKQSELFMKYLEKVLRDNSLEVFEYQLKINGFNKYFEARMAKVPHNEHVILISRDITEKEKFSRQYKSIFENVRESIFLHELDGTMIDVNPYMEKLHNQPKSKMIGRNVSIFFKKEDLERLEKFFEEVLINGYVEFQMELKKMDGTLFFASVESYLLELDGRQVVQGTIQDLSLEIKNNFFLNRSKKIFENLQEGVVLTDKNGYISEVNSAFENITGYSALEVIGNKMSLLSSGKYDEDFYKKMWSRLTREFQWSGNIENKKKNGKFYTSFLTISTIKDSDDDVQNYIGIFRDISKVVRYEEELKEKDTILIQQSKMAAMGEMIDNIAHQWKQPLNIISMSNSLIKMGQKYNRETSQEVIREAVENIEHEVMHLTTTINDFRNFFNPIKRKKEFLIDESMNKLLRLLQSRFKSNAIVVINRMQSITIVSIENELVQLFMNVINNAIDALEENNKSKRYIFLESFEENDRVIVSIKDNAGGIPDEIKEKIFESRFTTKEEGKGTGIGLYMSRQVIHGLGGTIVVENIEYQFDGENYKGANFIITIPRGI